jgi:hypothetical protein
MTTYEILSRKWNELDRDVFGLGGILSTHYLRTTVGGSLWAFGWALVVTHPVLLLFTLQFLEDFKLRNLYHGKRGH